MSNRRRNLFILAFVALLIVGSGIVIATKKTTLGLDLKGGTELIFQGRPTPQNPTISADDINRAIEIIRKRTDALGVSEPEISRLGSDSIRIGLPDVSNAARASQEVGQTAQLYFYDWEPNLIGPERSIGGHPGQNPPEKALKESEKRWQEAGRNTKSAENQQLIFAGAYPNAYQAALLASEQEPAENCESCSVAKPRYYLFEKDSPHKLLAGPELRKKDLYISPTGEKRPKNGIVIEVPAGTRPEL